MRIPKEESRHPFPSRRAAYTLSELCQTLAVLSMIFMLGAIMYPVFTKARESSNRGSCASNIKQIELGILQYLQDYDERFPPVAQPIAGEKSVLSGWAVTHTTQGEAAIPADTEGKSEAEKPFAASPLMAYLKNQQIFRCPNVPRKFGPLSYMRNDLTSGASQDKIVRVDTTVLMCDGEDFAGNTGHAYDPTLPPAPATFTPKGAVVLGATMQNAPKRHNGGANYGFADGHVKWMTPEKVFFPSRFDNSPVHKDAKTGRIVGPDPADEKEMAAKGLAATFHLR